MPRLCRLVGQLAVVLGILTSSGCPATPNDPIEKAISYLETSQTRNDKPRRPPNNYADYAGNWPQTLQFKIIPAYRIPEVSPFVVALVHHTLTILTDTNAAQIGVSQNAVASALTMRHRAMAMMQRFVAPPGSVDEGTYGFWPSPDPSAPSNPLLQSLLLNITNGTRFGGTRVPLNVSWFPPQLAIPTDADDTAAVYLAMLNDGLITSNPTTAAYIAHFFEDWRDTGAVPLRVTPSWLPPKSGAYLTWLAYQEPGVPYAPNDVDFVVVANVLHLLAILGKTDAAGFTDSVNLINSIVAQGIHRTSFNTVSFYYPDCYVLHYSIARAYSEGPVPSLQPAVNNLADELEDTALVRDGMAHWDKGDPDLNTALAVLTLIYAERSTPLIAEGVAYLEHTQNAAIGSWKEGFYFLADGDSPGEADWRSPALTTAFALEAILRYRLSLN